MALLPLTREWLSALRRRGPVPDLALTSVLPWLGSSSGFPRFGQEAKPEVSIVIPAFGQLPMTLRCLQAIARAEGSTPYEVILVDDGSEPPLDEAVAAVEGLRVVRLPTQQGFVGAANRGAEAARGHSLVFLNNDTAVCDGWIEALGGRLGRKGVGMVGAQLLTPDGRVQEAGGIVWRDGSATNYGRGLHPEAPAVSFSREVDYCSGACLMIARKLFEELGGFEESFAPGYYEDVDLAFRVRRRGLRVEYQPRARIYHFEGGTAGTDPKEGMKRFQKRNQQVLVDRWAPRLVRQPERSVEIDLARWSGSAGRCLVVDRHAPAPSRDAGSKRLVRILEEMQELDLQVTFAAIDLADGDEARRRLESAGIEVLRAPHVVSLPAYLRRHGAKFDCVVLCRLGVAWRLIQPVRRFCPRASVLFDTVDLRSVREARAAALRKNAKAQKRVEKTRARELEVVEQADVTLVTSPVERDFLSRQVRDAVISVVPTSYRTLKPAMDFDRRVGALFVGGFRHAPNLDAVLWFLDEIWPQVKILIPAFQLHVVGEEPPQELTRQASSAVHVHGHVPDLSSFFERVRMSIAPLRYGAGLKGKVHQSLARGLPCVATPVAAEGLGLMPDVHAVLAENANDFAEGIMRLNSDRDLWQRVSIEGRSHVDRYFSDATLKSGLHAALASRRQR
jgi:GT2 family glycosyltransferase